MKKVTLRLDPSDYEYIRRMAESKYDYGGLNLIIRQILRAFVANAKALEQKHQAKISPTQSPTQPIEAAENN